MAGRLLSELFLQVGEGGGGGQGEDPCAGENCRRGPFTCGEAKVGSLSAGDCQLLDGSFMEIWSFELEDPTEVTVMLTSQAFDTYLLLVEELTCLVLDENDDCTSDDLTKSCVTLSLPQGAYYAVANSLPGQPAGEYEIKLICPTTAPRFVRGDVNSDDVINLTDGILVLNFLFLGGRPPACMDAADANDQGNGAPNITDGVYIFNWLFLGGPAPAPPTPRTATYDSADCGPDPTASDGMDCRVPPEKCSP